LGQVLRHPSDRARKLDAVALVLQSAAGSEVMPPLSTPLRLGDRLLLCGTPPALRLVASTLNNSYTLRYLISGVDEPRSWLMRRLLAPATQQPATS
jgi:hypothetical protein